MPPPLVSGYSIPRRQRPENGQTPPPVQKPGASTNLSNFWINGRKCLKFDVLIGILTDAHAYACGITGGQAYERTSPQLDTSPRSHLPCRNAFGCSHPFPALCPIHTGAICFKRNKHADSPSSSGRNEYRNSPPSAGFDERDVKHSIPGHDGRNDKHPLPALDGQGNKRPVSALDGRSDKCLATGHDG